MTKLIINGEPASLAEQQWAHFHGHSVFTTLRSYQGEPLLWSRHWSRLNAHAQFFGYEVPDEQEILKLIKPETKAYDQKIRIIIAEHQHAMTFEPYESPDPSIYAGVTVIVSAMKPHPQLAAFKTGNSLPYAMALKQAKGLNAFEALMLDGEGNIIDGARSSIMMWDGKTLTAFQGGLEGCMREEVLLYAQKQGIAISRKLIKSHEINGQLLLANSLIGVVPVGEIKFDMVDRIVNRFRHLSNA